MTKIRTALIGCGRIALSKHVDAALSNSEKVEIVSVCDVIKERAERIAETLESRGARRPEITTSFRHIFNRHDIDAVIVATPSGTHYEISMLAMSHGKSVLVEKPMALSTHHMNDMINTARSRNLKLGVCFQNRFNPPVQELRKKIESGEFGQIFHGVISVRWNRNESYYRQAKWRGTWKEDGGVLMNQCTHGIDLLQWMLGGKVRRVMGLIKNLNHNYIEAEDLGMGVVEFHNGSVGLIEGTSNTFPENLEEVLTIFGKKGTVKIGGLAVNRIEVWRFENENTHPYMKLPDPETVYGSGHIALYRDFFNSLEADKEPCITGEEGRKAVDIVLGMYLSSLTGEWVEFPFHFSIEQMGDMNKSGH